MHEAAENPVGKAQEAGALGVEDVVRAGHAVTGTLQLSEKPWL